MQNVSSLAAGQKIGPLCEAEAGLNWSLLGVHSVLIWVLG